MSAIELSSAVRRQAAEIQPRHPHREIAELLATAMLRLRASRQAAIKHDPREVCLAFTGDQSVHTNPSDIEGVRN